MYETTINPNYRGVAPQEVVNFPIEIGQSYVAQPNRPAVVREPVFGSPLIASFRTAGMGFHLIDTRWQAEYVGADFLIAQVDQDGDYGRLVQGVSSEQSARVGSQDQSVFDVNPAAAPESFEVSYGSQGLLITNMDPMHDLIVASPVYSDGPAGHVEDIGAYYSAVEPRKLPFYGRRARAELRDHIDKAKQAGDAALKGLELHLIESSPFAELQPGNEVGPEQQAALPETGAARDRIRGLVEKARHAGAAAVDAFAIKSRERSADPDLPPQLDRLESVELLKKAEIHGTEYRGGQKLTTRELKRMGLEPKFPVELGDGVSAIFSDTFFMNDGRLAVIGYTQTPDGKVVARTDYFSNSQATWRYLPAYVDNAEDVHYDKGHGQESLDLPIDAQAALAAIARQGTRMLDPYDTELAFFGTARDLEQDKGGGKTYVVSVDRDSMRLNGSFYTEDFHDVPPPESLRFNGRDQAPDFTKLLKKWTLMSPFYGQVEMEVYGSYNSDATHQIAVRGHDAWTASVQNKSRVTEIGLRRRWYDGGHYKMTLHQYEAEAGGYGDGLVDGSNSYTSMASYLARTPTMRRYRAQRFGQ